MMRWSVVFHYTGLFLRIFSVLLLAPLIVGRYYGESFVMMESFLLAAFVSIVCGWLFTRLGAEDRPEAIEAMAIATFAWIFAVLIGAIPVYEMTGLSAVDAYFDAMSGFTTTGMVLLSTHELPQSLLFWRIFMQWIGGLGILTFFVMVLAESGGVASRLVSQEANKTESGVIRPSLFNAIKSMWYVYIVLTVMEALLLHYFDVPGFHAITHAMSTLPTGGFSSTGDFAGMMNGPARAVLTVFMFIGGTNFLLLYGLFQGNIRQMVNDYEFRLYSMILLTAVCLVTLDLVASGGRGVLDALQMSVFHMSSFISSTGFDLMTLEEFPMSSQAIIVFLMFVGGSLGSTTGGLKVLRFGVMIQVVKHRVREITKPAAVMNRILLKGRILEEDEINEIAAFFFLWLAVIFVGALVTIAFSGYDLTTSVQAMTSAVGTMGPTYLSAAEIRGLSPVVKAALAIGMLAGRLEMLPLLALLNQAISRHR